MTCSEDHSLICQLVDESEVCSCETDLQECEVSQILVCNTSLDEDGNETEHCACESHVSECPEAETICAL